MSIKNIKAILARSSSLDGRSLGLFRILFGLNIIYDIAVRIGDIGDFYGEHGIIQADLVREFWGASLKMPSIFFLSSSSHFQLGLLLVTFAFALAYTIGFWSRLASLVLVFLFASFSVRFPLVVVGHEGYLVWFLLVSSTLPVDAYFSYQSLRDKGPNAQTEVRSLSSVSFLLILGLSYFMPGLGKIFNENWRTGQGLLATFQPNLFSTLFAHSLLQYPTLLKILSKSLPFFETFVPLLICLTCGAGVPRLLLVGAMIGMHLGIAATMNVGIVSTVCISLWAALLPPLFWKLFKVKSEDGENKFSFRQPTLPSFLILVTLIAYLAMGLDFVPGKKYGRIDLGVWKRLGMYYNWRGHFSGPVIQSQWLQVTGSKEANGTYPVEVDLPFHRLRANPQEAWPEDFYHELCDNRMWQKIHNDLVKPEEQSPFVVKGLRRYICKNYGPGTDASLKKFIILVNTRRLLSSDVPRSERRKPLPELDCTREPAD